MESQMARRLSQRAASTWAGSSNQVPWELRTPRSGWRRLKSWRPMRYWSALAGREAAGPRSQGRREARRWPAHSLRQVCSHEAVWQGESGCPSHPRAVIQVAGWVEGVWVKEGLLEGLPNGVGASSVPPSMPPAGHDRVEGGAPCPHERKVKGDGLAGYRGRGAGGVVGVLVRDGVGVCFITYVSWERSCE